MFANANDNASAVLVPTRFVWPHGGRHVHLCGSFTRWQETLPMTPVDASSTVFSVVCSLPPGYHQYKFIVDGEWKHDEAQPFMPDPLGNVNNWLLVREPDPPPHLSAPSAAPVVRPGPLAAAHSILDRQDAGAVSARGALGAGAPAAGVGPEAAAVSADAAGAPASAAYASAGGGSMDVDSAGVDGPHKGSAAPAVAGPLPASPRLAQAGEPAAAAAGEADASRQRFVDFLQQHSAYELLPESGKVVALDVSLPVKQAFHALYEQGVPAAPLWDAERQEFVGMLSASDFISILTQLHSSSSVSLSEEELEQHSIAAWKAEKLALAAPQDAPHTPARRSLVFVGPDDSLRTVAELLISRGLAMLPVLHLPEQQRPAALPPGLASAPASSASSSAAGSVGAPASSTTAASPASASASALTGSAASAPGGAEAPPPPPQLLHLASLAGILKCVVKHFRHVAGSLPLLSQPLGGLPIGTWAPDSGRAGPTRPLLLLQPSTPLISALSLLLQGGVSSLPVVDGGGALVDVYARSDITTLAKDHAYARLNLDEFTVGQALQCRQDASAATTAAGTRCHMCLQSDSLRTVVERLAMPGVRRLICVEAGSRRVQGIVSLTDVFRFLLL